jgi:acyl carrier protein
MTEHEPTLAFFPNEPFNMLPRSEIETIVLEAIRATNLARQEDMKLDVSPTALLYSPGSHLDSLGLVSLLIEVEEGLRDAGVEVTLSDERAVSQKHSPFRDVPSLVAYIEKLIAELPA